MHNSHGNIFRDLQLCHRSVRYRSLSEIWVTLGASTAKTVIAQKVDSGGRSVGVPVIDGRRSHVENVTPDLQPCDSPSHQSSSNGVGAKSPREGKIFRTVLLRLNSIHRLTFFAWISCWSVPLHRNASSLEPSQNTRFFRRNYQSGHLLFCTSIVWLFFHWSVPHFCSLKELGVLNIMLNVFNVNL